LVLLPQHSTPPAAVSAQVCVTPAAIAMMLVKPVTAWGVWASVVVPLPS
jgi:hypothetical protein